MTKLEFLLSLREALSGLPQDEVLERLNFYREMIEDRVEEGLSEEEAVAAVGSVDEIAAQIIEEISHTKQQAKPKKRLTAWEIVLLVLGSPVWLSLLIAVVAVLFSLYVSLWAIIVALWAVFASFIGCAFGGIAGGAGFALGGKPFTGLAMIGAGLMCAGLSIFAFFGCKAATKGAVLLVKMVARGIKKRLENRREVE